MPSASQLIEEQRKKLRILVRKAPFVLSQMVQTSTPVDTGHARTHWFGGINEVSTQTYQEVTAKLNLGDKYFFTNFVEYIIYLEQGSSSQAPIGMVKVSVEYWQKIVGDIWSGL